MPETSNVTSETIRKWRREIQIQQLKVDEETGLLRNIYKRAKADGINTKEMRAAIRATRIEPDQAREGLRERLRYMALFGIEIARFQTDLFRDVAADNQTDRPLDDEIWEQDDRGYHAAMNGTPIGDNPNPAGSEQHVAWDRGHRRGQEAAARMAGPGVQQMRPSRNKPGRKASQPKLLPAPKKTKGSGTGRIGRPKGSKNKRKNGAGVEAASV